MLTLSDKGNTSIHEFELQYMYMLYIYISIAEFQLQYKMDFVSHPFAPNVISVSETIT